MPPKASTKRALGHQLGPADVVARDGSLRADDMGQDNRRRA